MENEKIIQLTGIMTISYIGHNRMYFQFSHDEPESIELEGLLLEGSAQLLRCGQLEFVTNKISNLKIN